MARSGDETIQPEVAEGELRTGEPPEVAGGLPAILSTMRWTASRVGVIRGARTLLRLNQARGFDCPGCAWPDPADRSVAEFCENGAKAVADEATSRRVTPAFFARHSVADLRERSDRWLNAQGRLTCPMVLREGAEHYAPIGWEEAFALIGGELRALASADEAIFYTSGRTSNEAAFLYQLFVREFGTNNLPDCSNMCHESSGVGLGEVIGVGKGTVQLEDFPKAGCILVVGQNPGTNHPRMMSALQEAARAGATIISVNPLRETGLNRFIHPQEVTRLLGRGTQLSAMHLPVRINGDVALFKGLCKAWIEAEDLRPGTVVDRDFIDARTEGFEAFADDLRATSWAEIEEGSGVPRDRVENAARVTMEADGVIVCWAMGLTQHENGVANVQSVVDLLLLGGNLGRPGAGACPVRGHSNVQGDRTMGIWDRPPASFLDALGAEFGFEPPREHGHDVVHAIQAMHARDAKIFFGMGGNFLSATPDTAFTAEALRRCRLTVQVSTKLNRSHLVVGEVALILPCLGRTEIDRQGGREQFVTVENSMGIVHRSQGKLAPASEALLSEPAIVAGVARAALPGSVVPWEELVDNYDRIRERIERVIPGFERYNARVREPGGFMLPNPVREGRFETDTGRAKFTVHPIPSHELAEGELLMMTIRSHDQYNTTVYGLDDRYRGISNGRRIVLMHPDDIEAQGLSPGQIVDLVSHYDRERIALNFAVVAYEMPRRSAATYFPEANVLVPVDRFARRSHTPISKSVKIRVRPH